MNINQIGQKKKKQAVRRLSQSSPAGQTNRKEDIRRRLASSQATTRGGRRKVQVAHEAGGGGVRPGKNLGPYKYVKENTSTGLRKHVSPLVYPEPSIGQTTSSADTVQTSQASKPVPTQESSKDGNVFGSNLFKKRVKKETVFVGSPFNTVVSQSTPSQAIASQLNNPKETFPESSNSVTNSSNCRNVADTVARFEHRISQSSTVEIPSSEHVFKSTIFSQVSTPKFEGENTQKQSETSISGTGQVTSAGLPVAIGNPNIFGNSGQSVTTGGLNVFGSTGLPITTGSPKVFGSAGLPVTTGNPKVFGGTVLPITTESPNIFGSSGQSVITGGLNVFGSAGLPITTGSPLPAHGTTGIQPNIFGAKAFPVKPMIRSTPVIVTSIQTSAGNVFGNAGLSVTTCAPTPGSNSLQSNILGAKGIQVKPMSRSTSITVSQTQTSPRNVFGSAAIPASSGSFQATSPLSVVQKDPSTSPQASAISATPSLGASAKPMPSTAILPYQSAVFGQAAKSVLQNALFNNASTTMISSKSPAIFQERHDSKQVTKFTGSTSSKIPALVTNPFLGKSVFGATQSSAPSKVSHQPSYLLGDNQPRVLTASRTIEAVQLPQDNTRSQPVGKGPSPGKSAPARRRRVSSSSTDVSELTAIVIKGLTKEYFDKALLTKLLSTFGEVRKISLQPAREQVIVTFDSHESAKNAKSKGLELIPLDDVGIYWCKRKRSNSGDISKVKSDRKARSEINKNELHLRKVSIQNALRNIDSTTFSCSMSAQERFVVLDEIDKTIRQAIKPYTDLASAPTIIGVCPDMCPEKERYMREDRMNLSVFEMVPGTQDNRDGEIPKVDHARAVKEYSRSAADKLEPLPHEMRPVGVLQLTMDYLAAHVMDNGEGRWEDWFHFLWDRTRAIRKDITQQHLCNVECAELVEKITRFHIFCAHYLCEEDMHTFDTKINNENLTKCLQTLKQIYEDLYRDKGTVCSKESEFMAYDILLNLNEGDTLRKAMQYRQEVRNSSEVKFALEVFSSLNSNNYVRFFKLLKCASYLNACIMHRYFTQMRSDALMTMSKAYRPQEMFPLAELVHILALEDKGEANEICVHYGFPTSDDCVQFSRAAFNAPEMIYSTRRAKNVIEVKRKCLIGEVICGSPLLPHPIHKPMDSFDAVGRYVGLTKLAQLLGSDTENPEPDTPDYYCVLDSSLSTHEVVVETTEAVDTVDNVQLEVRTQALQNSCKSIVEDAVDSLVTNICEDVAYEAELKRDTSKIFADTFLATNLPLVVREIASQCFKEQVERKREKIALIESINRTVITTLNEMLKTVLNTEVLAVAQQAVREAERRMKAQTLIRVSGMIMKELTEQEIGDECRDIAFKTYREMVKEKKTMLWRLAETLFRNRRRRYFRRWREQHHTLVYIKNILVHMPALPPNLTSQQQVNKLFGDKTSGERGTPSSCVGSHVTDRLELQRHLKEMATKQELKRLRTTEPVNILKSIEDLVRDDSKLEWMSGPKKDMYLKLVVSFPGHRHGTSRCWSKIEEIVKCKCTKSTEDSEPSRVTIPRPLETKVEVLSCYTLKTNEMLPSTHHLHIDIKACTGLLENDNLLLVQNHNLFRGLTGIFFLLNSTAQETDDMFWTSSRTRLREILKSKPRVPSLPLAILNCYDVDPTNETVMKELLDLDHLINQGFVSEWVVFQRPEIVGADQLHEQIVEVIQWLTSRIPSTPPLKCKSLKGFVENEVSRLFTIPLYEEIALRKHSKLQPQCPEVIVELYNAVIDHVIGAVTNPALQDISWPVPEFVHSSAEEIPSVSWNSSKRFQDMKRVLEKLKLPTPPALAEDGMWQSECTLCLDYVSQLLSSEHLKKFGFYLVTRVKKVLSQALTAKKKQTVTAADVPWPQVAQTCVDALLSWFQTLPQFSTDIFYCFEKDVENFSEPVIWRAAVMETLQLARQSRDQREKEKLNDNKERTHNVSADFEQCMRNVKYSTSISQPPKSSSPHVETKQKARLLEEKLYLEKRSSQSFEQQVHSALSESMLEQLPANEQGVKRKWNPTWTSNTRREKTLMRTSFNCNSDEVDMPDLTSTLSCFETSLIVFQDQLKLQRHAEELTERQLREAMGYSSQD